MNINSNEYRESIYVALLKEEPVMFRPLTSTEESWQEVSRGEVPNFDQYEYKLVEGFFDMSLLNGNEFSSTSLDPVAEHDIRYTMGVDGEIIIHAVGSKILLDNALLQPKPISVLQDSAILNWKHAKERWVRQNRKGKNEFYRQASAIYYNNGPQQFVDDKLHKNREYRGFVPIQDALLISVEKHSKQELALIDLPIRNTKLSSLLTRQGQSKIALNGAGGKKIEFEVYWQKPV